MTRQRALRLAREWSQGHVCSLRDGEAEEYHAMFATMLEESMPNEPLTLEQLREMDGEPVWVTPAGFWALVIAKRGQRVQLICNDGEKVWADKEIELVGPVYAYPPTHIDREAFCGSWEGEADGYANGELVYDVWRCSGCGHVEETDDPDLLPDFCPDCGLAMTEKAWAILEKRLRG